jgi:hypothetical protein
MTATPTCTACDHTGIGLPGCPTCDPRTKSEGGPRCDACGKAPCACALDLDAVEARCNAATPGPWTPCAHWRKDHCGCGKHPGYIWSGDGEQCVAQMGCQPDDAGQAYPEPDEAHSRANARFIAAARSDVPAIVREVRRLREAVAHADDALRRVNDGHSGDEESGEHDPDCRQCLVDSARAHIEHVLTGAEAPGQHGPQADDGAVSALADHAFGMFGDDE